MPSRILIFIVALAAVIGATASAAQAATITVNTTADTSASQCTLRNAIAAANSDAASGGCTAGAGADTIDASTQSGTITLATPLPNVSTAVAIQGPGSAKLNVSGNDAVRVFTFDNGTSSITGLTISNGSCGFGCGINNSVTLDLNDVTLTRNDAASTSGQVNGFPTGAAINNDATGVLTITRSTISLNSTRAVGATNQNSPSGGAIFNGGNLALDRTSVTGNASTAVGIAGSSTNANGGAISNSRNLTIRRSTLSGNSASGTGGDTNSATGGAISNFNSPNVNVVIDRSTISGNSATTGVPSVGNSNAGGFNVFGTSFSIKSSTITGNSAAGNANVVLTATAAVKNTIIADPRGGGGNCGGSGTSQGFNLTDGTGCGFNQASDRLSTSPMLDPDGLADNGGPTKTIALLIGSPAIDGGQVSAGETDDQRGRARPFDFAGVANAGGGDAADVGAFEVQAPPDTSVTSGPAEGSFTSDSTPTFELASTEPNSIFRCAVDDGPVGVCPTPFTTATLADGQHAIAFIAVDESDDPDPSPVTRTFSVDTVAPKVTISSGPSGPTSDSSPTFAFSTDEGGATVLCSIDGGTPAPCSGPGSSDTTASLAEGAHTFTVAAADQAGNVGNASRRFVVDTKAPETKIDRGPKKKGPKSKAKFAFSSGEDGAAFECALDGAKFAPCKAPLKLKHLKTGKHVFRVRAVDAVGNVDTTPASQKFKRIKKPEKGS